MIGLCLSLIMSYTLCTLHKKHCAALHLSLYLTALHYFFFLCTGAKSTCYPRMGFPERINTSKVSNLPTACEPQFRFIQLSLLFWAHIRPNIKSVRVFDMYYI